MKFVAIDCETGGIGLDKTLLTSYFGIYEFSKDNGCFTIIDDLYLETKDNDSIYRCTAEAMGVNKINIIEHDKNAITYDKARTILGNFLRKHSDGGKEKIIPIGHNVQFDIRFVSEKILKTLNNYISYRTLDTGSIGQFLKLCDLISNDNEGSLGSLAKKNGLIIDEQTLHNAKTDAQLTVSVLEGFVDKIKA